MIHQNISNKGLGFCVFLITFLIYWPALHYGFFWDDHILITDNSLVESLAGLGEIWKNPFALRYAYLPVTLTSFWLEHQLWGLGPFGYHFVNVLLHTLNAGLLFVILSKLKVPGAFFASLIFAWHPVQVESVIWISERKNLLAFFFYALAVICYLQQSKNAWLWYGWTFAFFLAAILSKPLACFLPLTLLLLMWWKKPRIAAKDLWLLLPFFIVSLAIGVFSIFVETHHIGAKGLRFPWSFSERLLIASRALVFYLERLFWPRDLTFLTPRWSVHVHDAWYLGLWTAAGLALILWCLRKNQKGILVGLLFFLIHLAPLLGFFNTGLMEYSFVANWWLYLPSAGLVALLGSAFERGFNFSPRFGKWILAGFILVVLIWVTSTRIPEFRDEEEILRRIANDHPKVPFIQNDLGMMLYSRDKLDAAESYLRKALELKPDYIEAHNNLAATFIKKRKFEEARDHLVYALALKPDYAAAHENLAIAYARLRQLDQAEAHFEEALRLNPYRKKLRENVELFRKAKASLLSLQFPDSTSR